jgi:8-oxo-dGTP pyrophosphatase MutT (NUDIX family)
VTDKPDWLRPHGGPWQSRSERLVFETPWIAVTAHETIAPTGRPAAYGKVAFRNLAIAILPLHDDGAVTLVGQHRFPLGDYSWEIPEGGGPLHVDPQESARRELAEEAGLQAAHWQEVLRLQLSNSVTDERAVGFLATGLSPAAGPEHADDTEALVLARAPFREVLEAALAGHIQDALTVAMLLRAYHMAREGHLPPALAQAMIG